MSDHITIPATGSGTATPSVGTDDVAGNHYQRMKLSNGEADSAVHLGVYAEDEASADGDTGLLMLGIQESTPANKGGTNGDYSGFQMSEGGLWVRPLNKIFRLSTDITRPADTTAYAVNDTLSDSTSAPTCFTWDAAARVSGGSGRILGVQVSTDHDAATPLVGEIFIFNQGVTSANDNAAWVISDAEAKLCIDRIPFSLEDIGNNGFYSISNLAIAYTCVGSDDLRFLIRVKNAYTPASAQVLTFAAIVEWLD